MVLISLTFHQLSYSKERDGNAVEVDFLLRFSLHRIKRWLDKRMRREGASLSYIILFSCVHVHVGGQVKVVEVRGCEFRFWIQSEGRAPEIPQAV